MNSPLNSYRTADSLSLHLFVNHAFSTFVRYLSIIVFLAFAFVNYTEAQSLAQFHTQLAASRTLPPPNAASLGRYGEIAVSAYSGVPNIQVPLFELKDKNTPFNVSLSYHANGVKVEQEASNVGLGWALNCGGVITRVVRHYPDIGLNEYGSWYGVTRIPFYASTYDFCSPSHTYGENIEAVGLYDYEPDIFYYNFAGKSGSFTIVPGSTGPLKAQPTDLSPISIQYKNATLDTRIDNTNFFQIIAEDGTIYVFDQKEWAEVATSQPDPSWRNYLTPRGYGALSSYSGAAGSDANALERMAAGTNNDYISSWYLTRIIAPDGGEITLSYMPIDQPVTSWSSQAKRLSQISRSQVFTDVIQECLTGTINVCGGSYTDNGKYWLNFTNGLDHITSIKQYDEITLKEVSAKNWRIKFVTSERDDINNRLLRNYEAAHLQPGHSLRDAVSAHKYDSILLYSKQGSGWGLSRGYKLTYSMFLSGTGGNENLKRLKLDKVKEFSPKADKPAYVFTYNSTELPAKDAMAKDYWGNYNNNSENSLIPGPYPTLPIVYTGCNAVAVLPYPMADRSVDANKVQAAILTAIEFPTGGQTKFEYEPNVYLKNGIPTFGAGCRIKSMRDYYTSTDYFQTSYDYSASTGGTSGKLLNALENVYTYEVDHDIASVGGYQKYNAAFLVVINSENPLTSFGSSSSGDIGYDRVVISKGAGNPNDSKVEYIYWNTPSAVVLTPPDVTWHAPSSLAYSDSKNGLLKSMYERKGTEVKRSEEYTYSTFNLGTINGTSAFMTYNAASNPCSGNTQVGSRPIYYRTCYSIPLTWSPCTNIRETVFEGSQSRTTFHDYEYANQLHKMKTSETISAIGIPTRKIVYSYPDDYDISPSATDPIYRMQQTGMHTPLIGTISYIKNDAGTFEASSGSYLYYQLVNQVPFPDRLFTFYNDNPVPVSPTNPLNYVDPAIYDLNNPDIDLDFDNNFNPSKIQTKGKPVERFQWGYSGTLPTAKCVGCKSNGFLFASFDDNTTGTWQSYTGGITSSDAKSGKYSYSGTLIFPSSFNPSSNIKYELSFWMRGGQINLTNGNQQIHFDASPEWVPVKVQLYLNSAFYFSASQCVIDDISVVPIEGQLFSFSYDYLHGLTSSSNPNGEDRYYNYDGLGRLKEEKDLKGNVTKSYIYRYLRK